MTYKIGQKFTGTYPPEASQWCNNNNACIEKEGDDFVIVDLSPSGTQELEFQISNLEQNLKDTDYKSIKASEGDPSDDWEAVKEQRASWRVEIRDLTLELENATTEAEVS